MSISVAHKSTSRLQARKFGLWVGLGSIVMMFVALTSAYIVRRSAGNWVEFRLPDVFFISTVIILLSSVSLELSYRSFLNGKTTGYRGWLILTIILGALFCYTQYIGWLKLYDIGMPLNGNPSGSFLYAITALHVAHVVGGIGALLVALFHAFHLPYFVSEERKVRFQMVLYYWHFVDVLWIYLLIFLLIFR